jgi:hypothetical protein
MNPFFHLQFQVVPMYKPLFETLYQVIVLFLIFYIMHHSISNKSLFIHTFQGPMFSYSFLILLCVLILTVFTWYLFQEHLLRVEWISSIQEDFVLLDE